MASPIPCSRRGRILYYKGPGFKLDLLHSPCIDILTIRFHKGLSAVAFERQEHPGVRYEWPHSMLQNRPRLFRRFSSTLDPCPLP